MAISPWAKGQTSPTWTIQMTRDGGVAMDLTNVGTGQLSLVIYNASHAIIGTGAGAFTIKNVNPGIVQYHPDASDSDTTGSLYVRVVIDFNSVDPDMSDYLAWQVNP